MPQSPFDRTILVGLAALIAASAANAQSFNIDLSTFGTGTPAPPPASTYGAAAAQPGVWNNITDGDAFLAPLVNLAGAATPATISLIEGSMGAFAGANANATPANSNSEFLLDDGWRVAGRDGGFIILRDLAPGLYNIYTYGVAPDSNTDLTRVLVIDAFQDSQIAGGALPSPFLDSYALGLTHTFHTLSADENPVFIFIDDTDGQAQTINGLQIKKVVAIACHEDIAPVCTVAGQCGCGDGSVGSGDLAQLLSKWGPCVDCCEDLAPVGTGDDAVGSGDLAQLLSK